MASAEQRTSGSSVREGHPVNAECLRYSLNAESQELQAEVPRTSGGRTAKTLAKSDNLRVTLVHLRAGTKVHPTASAGAATLHILQGRLSVEMSGTPETAGPGELLVFTDNLRQPIQALEDCTFLVTVAWEEGAGAWDQEEQQGHH
jgi:quercetin dioxygenase-like cupin family protein